MRKTLWRTCLLARPGGAPWCGVISRTKSATGASSGLLEGVAATRSSRFGPSDRRSRSDAGVEGRRPMQWSQELSCELRRLDCEPGASAGCPSAGASW